MFNRRRAFERWRRNKIHPSERNCEMHETQTVPIGLLLAEGFDLSAIRHRFADQLLTDDAGLSCLPASTVRSMINERDEQAAAAAARRAEQIAEAERRGNPIRDRVRAIAAAQDAAGGPQHGSRFGIESMLR
jgi:hypothetical protein